MEKPTYEYHIQKNAILLKERGVGFEDIIATLNSSGPFAIIDHPNPIKYLHQKIYLVDIEEYVYLIPFERQGAKALLKTIYPSRKATRLYQERLLGGNK